MNATISPTFDLFPNVLLSSKWRPIFAGIVVFVATILYTVSARAATNVLGAYPNALLQGKDGFLYGTAEGGTMNGGIIFKVGLSGDNFTVLHNFGGKGSGPTSLIEGRDGFLYGTTSVYMSGNAYGTIFRIAKQGTGFRILRWSLSAGIANLLEASDGKLYATIANTDASGSEGFPRMFRINKDGSGYTSVVSTFPDTDPVSFVEGSDGSFYVALRYGPKIFKVARDGIGFSMTPIITDSGFVYPSQILEGPNGRLYVAAATSGESFYGTGGLLLDVTKDGTVSIIYSSPDGYAPTAMTQGSDGALHFLAIYNDYGTISPYGGIGYLANIPFTPANTAVFGWDQIYRFPSGTFLSWNAPGAAPGDSNQRRGLIQSNNGLLYGLTHSDGNAGLGTIFRINHEGTGFAVVHHFGDPPSATSTIAWQHVTGKVSTWQMADKNFLGATPIQTMLPAGAHLVGCHDFDKDGDVDLLIRSANASLIIWYVQGTTVVQKTPFAPAKFMPPTARIAGFSDMNQDDSADLIWQFGNFVHVWTLNGSLVTSERVFGGNIGSRLVAVRDFNADSHPDLLWQTSSGTLQITYLNGTAQLSTKTVVPSRPADSRWRLIGAGRFNDDQIADLLWQHDDGRVAVWTMNGNVRSGAALLREGKPVSPGWKSITVE